MPPLILTNTASGATARVLPEAGFTCYSLKIPVGSTVVDVLDSEPNFAETGERPTRNGIPLLFPFPNRVRAGRYQFGGKSYELTGLRLDDFGNIIHGMVFDRPWRVVELRENAVTGRFRLSVDAPERRALWPADFIIDVRYELLESSLHCDLRIQNPDSVPLPWGFGTHAYFKVPLSPTSRRGDCIVQAPAARQWELVDNLPTGRLLSLTGDRDVREGQELGDLKYDDVYTDLEVRRGQISAAVLDPAAGLQITQTTAAAFRELVVFTPPHGRSVCLEPYTCVTDAINMPVSANSGLQILAPGTEFRTWFAIHASLIYA